MSGKKEFEIDVLHENIRQSYAHVQDSFNEAMDKIQTNLEEITSKSEKFVGSSDTYTEQFGSKVISIVTEIRKPEEINLKNIKRYIRSLDIFHRKIIYYGARWLRKAGPMHKFQIGQIERKRRQLLNLTKDLNALFSSYQSELEKCERAESIARKIFKLEEEKAVNKKSLGELDEKLKEQKKQIEKEEKEIHELKQKEDFIEAREFKKEKEMFEEQVKTELKYIEKPILKSLKLVEDKSIKTDQHKIIQLGRFIDSPKNVLLNIENIKIIEDALLYLQDLMKGKKLNLKSSRNRKGMETISSLLKNGKIKEYQNKFNKYSEHNRKLEAEGVIGNAKELEEIKQKYLENKEELDFLIQEKKRNEKKIASCEERVKEYRIKLEELI